RFSRDWSSDVCSSDLPVPSRRDGREKAVGRAKTIAYPVGIPAPSGGSGETAPPLTRTKRGPVHFPGNEPAFLFAQPRLLIKFLRPRRAICLFSDAFNVDLFSFPLEKGMISSQAL